MNEDKSQPIGPQESPETGKTTTDSAAARPQIEMLFRDILKIIPLFIIGYAMIRFSPDFAVWVAEPAFSAWGLVIGGTFHIMAFSHIARRILFPKLDLYVLGVLAEASPVGAGLVFVGICLVLSKIIEVMAIAIQLR